MLSPRLKSDYFKMKNNAIEVLKSRAIARLLEKDRNELHTKPGVTRFITLCKVMIRIS